MQIVAGKNAVFESLNNETLIIERIYVRYGVEPNQIRKLKLLARKKNVQVSIVGKDEFNELCKKFRINLNTQGFIALTSDVRYFSLDELMDEAYRKSENPVIVFAYKINDPQNLGAIARSVECSGAQGLLVTVEATAPVNELAIKASAGALLHIPIAKVQTPTKSLEILKEKGFTVVGTDVNAEMLYFEETYKRPIVLLIGNEAKGLSEPILKRCDLLVKIPMFGKVQSLNASVAASVILFEILRQRIEKGL